MSYTPSLTHLLLHAYSYTPTLTHLLKQEQGGRQMSYTPTLTRLLLHAYSYTPTLTRLLLHAYSSREHGGRQMSPHCDAEVFQSLNRALIPL